MKEAIIVDLDGLYVEPELVPLTEQGVTEIYETPEPPEPEEGQEPEEIVEIEPILVAYRVAIPVPQGLYKPRFDLEAWREAWNTYNTEMEAYNIALADWYANEEEGEKPILPDTVDEGSFWIEGLTQEELDLILNAPKPKTELDILGEQLVQRELEALELKSDNLMLGQQIVDLELRLLAVEGGISE